MISRRSLEARITKLEKQKYSCGRVFVINVRDGEQDGPRVASLFERMRVEHGLNQNRRDIVVSIRSFTDDREIFEKISDEVKIHKMVK